MPYSYCFIACSCERCTERKWYMSNLHIRWCVCDNVEDYRVWHRAPYRAMLPIGVSYELDAVPLNRVSVCWRRRSDIEAAPRQLKPIKLHGNWDVLTMWCTYNLREVDYHTRSELCREKWRSRDTSVDRPAIYLVPIQLHPVMQFKNICSFLTSDVWRLPGRYSSHGVVIW